MKNISDTEAYTVYDFVFSKALRALSRVVGVRKLTKPFWNRWRASNIGDATLFRFLDGVGSIDDWPSVGERIVAEEVAIFEKLRAGMKGPETVDGLRRLSYLCNMAHWGALPISDQKIRAYRQCRDYYIEAESMAFGDRYRRVAFPWRGGPIHGNLHLPETSSAADRPAPLVIIVHGIDGCKEEHLATELALAQAGLSVLGIDGPGQAEALLLDGLRWTEEFHEIIACALDKLADDKRVDTHRVGLIGFSIGGMWAIRAASGDARIKALYDLGGPINTRRFSSLPFLLKTKLCQVTGARDARSIAEVLGKNSIEDDAILAGVSASVRMIHGARDRVVSTADKKWLRDRLLHFRPAADVSLEIIADGDHCCTGHSNWIRPDMVQFFIRTLRARN